MGSGVLSGWSEAILFSIAFLIAFTSVIALMNIEYGQNHEVPLTDTTTIDAFTEYMGTSKDSIEEGTVEYDSDQGITLKESYGLAKNAITIMWNFITGGWIEDVVLLLNLGDVGDSLAIVLRILYFLSLVFGLLYALFKIAM